MKKTLGLLSILAVLAITSCGGNSTATETTGTDTLKAVDSTVKSDSTCCADTTKAACDSAK